MKMGIALSTLALAAAALAESPSCPADQALEAYRRGDLFEKRRLMMEAWADYLNSANRVADVIPLRNQR